MLLENAIQTVEKLIATQEAHPDYDHVVELAQLYRRLITGKDVAPLLKRFARRETEELFEQRVNLTQIITPAMASSLQNPFFKVARNEKIKKRLEIKEEVRKETVENMLDLFWGNDPDQNGLDLWLQTRFSELTFVDPNTWIVVEFDEFDATKQFAQPRPYEVPCAHAVNWRIVNETLEWLFIREPIKVIERSYTVPNPSRPTRRQEVERVRDGFSYTMYNDTHAIQYREVDKKYLDYINYTYPDGEILVEIEKKFYLVRVVEPKIGFVPAFRIGYKRDVHTDGRTFVNPWHDALPYFMKSVKTVSEMDLTMALHAFPQKIQYVQRCPGKRLDNGAYKPCNRGVCNDGSTCEACRGTGHFVHATAQDVIMLPMPADKEEELNLSNIVHYVSPDIALIEFQNKYGNELQQHAHRAVFNSTVFVETQFAKTATEKDLDMDSVYDTLLPFSKKFSWCWKFVARTAIVLADVPENDRQEVIHAFPADFKLKTVGLLINQLKTMNDSGAPPFVKENINEELAELIHAGDDLAVLKYKVKRSFYPFNGKTDEEIALLIESPYVPITQKVLYANFEAIFALIEEEDPLFWYLESFSEQKKKVDAKVEEFKAITDEETPSPTFNSDNSSESATRAKEGKDGLETEGNNPDENEA
jgi:hypothetical protein